MLYHDDLVAVSYSGAAPFVSLLKVDVENNITTCRQYLKQLSEAEPGGLTAPLSPVSCAFISIRDGVCVLKRAR